MSAKEYWVSVEADGRIFLTEENDGEAYRWAGPERRTHQVTLKYMKQRHPQLMVKLREEMYKHGFFDFED